MLIVVSPAKKLDWSKVDGVAQTEPAFGGDAVRLAKAAGRLSQTQLRKLMDISEDLAALNQKRFRSFSEAPSAWQTRPAAFAFAGDTYRGLDARSLDADALAYAQDHLRILSGLYGLLRPCDAIQPYRLEMGSKLKTRAGPTLYAYWGDRIAGAIAADARASGSDMLLNCASQEYFGAVQTDALALPVVTPSFLEEADDGTRRLVSFHAKTARGALARFVVERRLRRAEDLVEFDLGGYRIDRAASTACAPVFVRPDAARSAA